MSTQSPDIISIHPRELIENSELLEAIALSYLPVFNRPAGAQLAESIFEDDHKIEDVKARIIKQTGAIEAADRNAHLILVTVPWDESVHTAEDFYLKVLIEEAPVAVVGCLLTMGDRSREEVKQSVKETATMFMPTEAVSETTATVDEAFEHLTEERMEKMLYVPEVWVRKDYRGAGLLMMAKLGDELMQNGKLIKDEILMWTDRLSQKTGKEASMYRIMKSILGGEDFFQLADNRVLMVGNCRIAYDNLQELTK